MNLVTFTVRGAPQPQGSKKHVGGGRMVESAKGLKAWRRDVTEAAEIAMADRCWLDGPLALTCVFLMRRPKYHYRTGRYSGLLKEGAPVWHIVKPDGDKLLRAIGDSLTGIVYADDSQIARSTALKVYSDEPGVFLTVSEMRGVL